MLDPGPVSHRAPARFTDRIAVNVNDYSEGRRVEAVAEHPAHQPSGAVRAVVPRRQEVRRGFGGQGGARLPLRGGQRLVDLEDGQEAQVHGALRVVAPQLATPRHGLRRAHVRVMPGGGTGLGLEHHLEDETCFDGDHGFFSGEGKGGTWHVVVSSATFPTFATSVCTEQRRA